MTRDELVALIRDTLIPQWETVMRVAGEGRNFLENILVGIDNPAIAQVLDQQDIDELITIQLQQYAVHLTALETSSDALGTDPFH